MGDERKEILKMLADGAISVDDAERLLRALDEGDQKRTSGLEGESFGDSLRVSLDSLGDTLSEIGPAVKNVVEEAVSNISGLKIEADDLSPEEQEAMEPAGNVFSLPTGGKLLILNRAKPRSGSANLIVEGIEGTKCTVEPEGAEEVEVMKGAGCAVIRWTSGNLKVQVPDSMTELRAATMGGKIVASRIRCGLDVKTMGGDLTLEDVSDRFSAKTMGGNVHVLLGSTWKGDSKAVTMGGAVSMLAPHTTNAEVVATTFGGRIEVTGIEGHVTRGRSLVKQRLQVVFGEEKDSSRLRLKTMGGDIVIRRMADGE